VRSATPAGLAVAGVALADQVKNLDWRERHSALLCRLPAEVVEDVLEKLLTLIEPMEAGE
jgi:mRNA interferase MazF